MATAPRRYEPHPYALLLPPLTAEEYAALKADIARNGIQLPIVVDEDGKILDGVHRNRIAAELGIEVPAAVREGLNEDGKLALALGLNLYRRHFTADRRRDLVANLLADGLSVRRIATATGWGKSTIGRDVQDIRDELAREAALWLWCERGEPKLPRSSERRLKILGKTADEVIREAGVDPAPCTCLEDRDECCPSCGEALDRLISLNQGTRSGRASFLRAWYQAYPPACLDDLGRLQQAWELFSTLRDWRDWLDSAGISEVVGAKLMGELDAATVPDGTAAKPEPG